MLGGLGPISAAAFFPCAVPFSGLADSFRPSAFPAVGIVSLERVMATESALVLHAPK